MNNRKHQSDPQAGRCQHRRGRRREFFNALRQSQDSRSFTIIDLGQRLREKRSARSLTIRDLAKKSGLNVNTLSMIENGKASPSIETLQQLSFALEIPIAAFFEENTPRTKIAHHKASQRPGILFAHGVFEDLGAGMPRNAAETYLVTLNASDISSENLVVHTGRETVFCLEGQLAYTVDDQTFDLEPGDSLSFEAHLPHRLQNKGAAPARLLLVLCPSDEQDRPTERHFALVMPGVDGG